MTKAIFGQFIHLSQSDSWTLTKCQSYFGGMTSFLFSPLISKPEM